MNNNETEFANQDEEISYKDMWLRLKAKVEALRQEAIDKAEDLRILGDFSGYKELFTVLAWIDTVLSYMKEEENGK
jgi:hypothetical protein